MEIDFSYIFSSHFNIQRVIRFNTSLATTEKFKPNYKEARALHYKEAEYDASEIYVSTDNSYIKQ